MPKVPFPEDLPSEADLKAKMLAILPPELRSYWERERPIELRPVDVSRYFAREKRAPEQCIWMRASGRLPDTLSLHQCVLAYASDFSPLDTALIAHGKLMFDKDVQLAASTMRCGCIGHSGPTNGCSMPWTVPPASRARGFCRGSVYTGMVRWCIRRAGGTDAAEGSRYVPR
jgi:acyl-CoA thioesterase-2